MCIYIILCVLIIRAYIGNRLTSPLIRDTPYHISPQLLLDCGNGNWVLTELPSWGSLNVENKCVSLWLTVHILGMEEVCVLFQGT